MNLCEGIKSYTPITNKAEILHTFKYNDTKLVGKNRKILNFNIVFKCVDLRGVEGILFLII